MRTKDLTKKLRLNKLTIANMGGVLGGKIVATDTGKIAPTETCYCAPVVDGENQALVLVISVNDCDNG